MMLCVPLLNWFSIVLDGVLIRLQLIFRLQLLQAFESVLMLVGICLDTSSGSKTPCKRKR